MVSTHTEVRLEGCVEGVGDGGIGEIRVMCGNRRGLLEVGFCGSVEEVVVVLKGQGSWLKCVLG